MNRRTEARIRSKAGHISNNAGAVRELLLLCRRRTTSWRMAHHLDSALGLLDRISEYAWNIGEATDGKKEQKE